MKQIACNLRCQDTEHPFCKPCVEAIQTLQPMFYYMVGMCNYGVYLHQGRQPLQVCCRRKDFRAVTMSFLSKKRKNTGTPAKTNTTAKVEGIKARTKEVTTTPADTIMKTTGSKGYGDTLKGRQSVGSRCRRIISDPVVRA